MQLDASVETDWLIDTCFAWVILVGHGCW